MYVPFTVDSENVGSVHGEPPPPLLISMGKGKEEAGSSASAQKVRGSFHPPHSL